MELGAILRACRVKMGWSQEKMGSAMHMEQAIISRIETNRMVPNVNVVREWATKTDCQELLVIYLMGAESMPIIQQVLEGISGTIGFISMFM
ncbi:helix-turn-helix domain-containing protein [Geomicrobium sp. JCM 19038]|uniref:helix-turn-helix domain-containing protein n=1 Tax=Geomicrobium sp. JCM 19038 TaxID=1460635 RepID=UPI00045F1529|nr:helix-turn-helix transcriptional regulator [Geomicrobium sp. JCM 19038]GAK09600.1 hypothetical protein JCM19038_3442 [Geomicrobium sp. JCM 19038]